MQAPVRLYLTVSIMVLISTRFDTHPSSALVDSQTKESTIDFNAAGTPVDWIPFASCRSSGCDKVSCRCKFPMSTLCQRRLEHEIPRPAHLHDCPRPVKFQRMVVRFRTGGRYRTQEFREVVHVDLYTI